MGRFDGTYLGVMLDMAGCPNRCRHCWLGAHRNGSMSVDDFRRTADMFRGWRDENGKGLERLGFFSWWREPDFHDDYRTLWQLEQELSSPGCAQRFELLSTWRLARDKSYAAWAAGLALKVCQISFFGMEENTDWGMRRHGAFRDQLAATERCLDAGITPRWQLFLTKRCLGDLDAFCQLLEEYRVSAFFIGSISPEGCGYELEDERLEQSDLERIPHALVRRSRDGVDLLGQTEAQLMAALLCDDSPPNMSAVFPCVAIDADFDVYPNIAEPAPWWKLGNLKTDGVDAVVRTYRDEMTPGMRANRTLPVSVLARHWGRADSQKLYDKGDLISRLMHQWGAHYMEGESDDE